MYSSAFEEKLLSSSSDEDELDFFLKSNVQQ